jgi:uncharacterized OB-fold protein
MSLQQCDDPEHGTGMSPPVPPLPAVTPLTSAFSEALRDGVRLQHCASCGFVIYYPRVACPECLSVALEWRPVSGVGELLSYGIIWRPLHPAFADKVPLWLCTVRLREGPIVVALVGDVGPEDVSIGTPVRLVGVEVAGGVRVPRFVPAGQ